MTQSTTRSHTIIVLSGCDNNDGHSEKQQPLQRPLRAVTAEEGSRQRSYIQLVHSPRSTARSELKSRSSTCYGFILPPPICRTSLVALSVAAAEGAQQQRSISTAQHKQRITRQQPSNQPFCSPLLVVQSCLCLSSAHTNIATTAASCLPPLPAPRHHRPPLVQFCCLLLSLCTSSAVLATPSPAVISPLWCRHVDLLPCSAARWHQQR